MEKRIATRVNDYMDSFRLGIKDYLENNASIDMNSKGELLKFVYDYNNISLTKEDFAKRKRVKSITEQYLRCNACRANGEQCTRKKKEDSLYCGTHDKNRPHGVYVEDSKNVPMKKIEVHLQEIKGILYYIDNNGNVYKTEDIVSNKVNPSIISKYKVEGSDYVLI